jgi:hypothetical protein
MPRNSKQERDRERADDAKMFRAWKKFHRDELGEALVGLHRDVMSRLMAHLERLRSARELVAFIEAQDWGAIDAHTRLVALHEINEAICTLREKQRLPAIDDALPGEPLRAYQIIHGMITKFPAPSGEASSELPSKQRKVSNYE